MSLIGSEYISGLICFGGGLWGLGNVQCFRVVVTLQISHVVTCFGTDSGKNRTKNGKPFMDLVERATAKKGVTHVVLSASNPYLCRSPLPSRLAS